MVPEGWKLSTIEEVSNVSSGGTPSRKNDTYWNGNIPWVTTAEVQFKVIEDTSEKITEEGLANSSAKLFPVNTILMAMYGQGKTRGQVAKLGIEASTNQACAAIVLHPGYEVDYYYQFLISQYENIREMANSGGQENLSGGIVKSIQVPVPPYPEQKKIAQILSTWDKAITTTEQLLTTGKQQKKALMQQLLTGKKRLLDKNGVRFSGEWKHGHLSDLGKITKGKALSSKDLIDGDYPVIAGGKSSPYNHRDYTHENVITVSASGAYAGYVAYHPYKLWASDCSVVMGKSNSNIGFIYQLMSHMQSKIYSLQSGGAQPHVYPKDLEVLRVSIPPVDEQQKIAAVLSSADQEITALQQKLNALKQEKKALMQQLLMGKRRVTVEEAA
ncbi:restriction endonuclease subunit S [Vibrio cholerae]